MSTFVIRRYNIMPYINCVLNATYEHSRVRNLRPVMSESDSLAHRKSIRSIVWMTLLPVVVSGLTHQPQWMLKWSPLMGQPTYSPFTCQVSVRIRLYASVCLLSMMAKGDTPLHYCNVTIILNCDVVIIVVYCWGMEVFRC